MRLKEEWDDLFDVKIGSFGMGAYFGRTPLFAYELLQSIQQT
jgi:hypothetical protein